jgi:hypothetical protein
MIIFVLLAALVGFQAPALDQVDGGGLAEYEYIGCHTVTENPKDGNAAFGPFGVATSTIYFKQISEDGTVGPVTTATPC